MQIVEFDSFDTAFPIEPGKEDEAKRLFMTLFVTEEKPAQIGGTSYVCRAQSVMGKSYALKRLLPSNALPASARLSNKDRDRITQSHEAAFFEEYRNQVLVSHLRGFPKLYGYGSIDGKPAILMEWIEGASLDEAAQLVQADDRRLDADVVAALGIGVLKVLDTLTSLDSTLVHRDISPANIMVRTSTSSLDEQIECGIFDICLVDFGSAATDAGQEASFTMTSQVWRHGTPEYAPPEMLTQDLPHIEEMRKSQSIDVFALCSVLYELYCGHTPWRVAEHPEKSPFRIKTEAPPEPLVARRPEDAILTDAIMAGLALSQADRPSVQSLLQTLNDLCAAYGSGKEANAFDLPATEGHESPRLYTSGGTHLEVAGETEGGKRAGKAVPQFSKKQRAVISRRGFVFGGIVIVAAAIGGGAIAARSCGGGEPASRLIDGSLLAAEIYTGSPLYPARAISSNTWMLLGSTTNIDLDAKGREPGRMVGGIIKAYNQATGGYGFKTPVADNEGNVTSIAWCIGSAFADAGDFSTMPPEGNSTGARIRLAPVQDFENGLWGYIDDEGGYQIMPSFSAAGGFSNGCAPVRDNGRGRLWGAIDDSGTQVMPPTFSGLGLCSEEHLMAASKEVGRWGFASLDGIWVIPDSFPAVHRFTEGLAGFQNNDTGLWGFIDVNGKQVIEAEFLDVRPFASGLAPAQDSASRLWGLIDTAGEWHVEPQWLSLGEKTGDLFPAHGSPAGIYDIFGKDEGAWKEHEKTGANDFFFYGYVDADGNWIHQPEYGDTLIRKSPQ